MIDAYVVHLHGSHTAEDLSVLRKELGHIEAAGGVVVLDLRMVADLDDEAIAALVKTRDFLRSNHGQLRLVIDNTEMEARLQAASGSVRFDIYGYMESATLDC